MLNMKIEMSKLLVCNMFCSQFDTNLVSISYTDVTPPCLQPAPASHIVSFKLVNKMLARIFIIINFPRHKLNEKLVAFKLAWLVQCSSIQNLAT